MTDKALWRVNVVVCAALLLVALAIYAAASIL